MSNTAKEVYEHLEVIFACVEDTVAEASFDYLLDVLIHNTDRRDAVAVTTATAVATFQNRYRRPKE